MKNILIPSDFSIKSLDYINDLLYTYRNEQMNIVLVHVFLMSDSITELMLLSRRRKEYDFISPEFWNRCKQLEYEHWPQINSIRVECFYGSTVAVFKNFLEGQKIDEIVYPQHYQFRKLSKMSLDPARLIARSGLEVKLLTSESMAKEATPVSRKERIAHSLPRN
jgi:hypothetical protein